MASPNLLKPIQKREIELDFVRGIAILMVLDFHSKSHALFYPFVLLGFNKHFGWAGVDVFFVLSGFLVGGLLIKEWKVRGRIDSKQFLIRRGFKIWPQYYVFIFAMLLTGWRSLHQLWGNLLNIQNYVGGVAHTWSLAVEEHAYLFLVFCMAIAARRKTRMRSLFFFLIGVVLLVVAMQLFFSWKGFNIFTWTHTRIDGILCGVMLAIVYHYRPQVFHRLQDLWWIWAILILAFFGFFRFFLNSGTNSNLMAVISWDMANLMGVGMLMLLYRHRPEIKRSAPYRFVAWIGLYSYGIYLWHVAAIAQIMRLGHRLPPAVGNIVLYCGPLISGILIGIIFTKLVEFPALRLRDRLFPRRVDTAVGTPAEIEEDQIARQTS